MIKKMFVIFAAVFVAGCATVARTMYNQPVISFQDIRVNGIGLDGGSIDVVLGVYNPNEYSLDALKLSYRLLVDSTLLGEGVYDSRFTINEGDSTIVHLPVSLSYAGLANAGRQLLGRGSVDYRVTGALTINTPLGEYNIPYNRIGRFNNLTGNTGLE